MHRSPLFQLLLVLCCTTLVAGAPGCVNKPVLGDREGFQEVEVVQAITEARKAVQWVETDLDGYEPASSEALRDRDGVLVQWARVRDRAEELQGRLDGMTSQRWSDRDPRLEPEFYQSASERAQVLRQETSRLLSMWASMNEKHRTMDKGVGSRQRRD